MICPNCGEPVQSRHLFCVVCGADFKKIKPENAGVRLKKALTKPIAVKKAEKAPDAADKTAGRQENSAAPEAVSFPDFMHNFT